MTRLLTLLACLPVLLGVVFIQVSGPPPWTYTESWTSDPFSTDWTIEKTGGAWISAGSGTLSDDGVVTTQVEFTHDDEAFPTADGAAITQVVAGTASSDWNGLIIRCDETATWSTDGHLALRMNGVGRVTIWEQTGSTTDSIPCSACVDVGNITETGAYVGWQWAGAGRGLVVRVWDFDTTPPSNLYDWTTWGTCMSGISDTGSAPGCTEDVVVGTAYSTSGYADGTCIGIVHHDSGANGDDGVQEIWASE